MRSLKNILESILAGQDTTLKNGDNIEAEFELLKRSAQNKKNWILSKSSAPNGTLIRSYKLFVANDLPTICGLFGVKNSKTLRITITGVSGGWRLSIAGINESDKCDFNVSDIFSVKYGTPFTKLHKEHVCPLFDNFDDFVKFVESKIRK